MYSYLMFDGKRYKIGKSNDPIKRLKQLSTGNPFLKLIATSETISEQTLHNLLRHKRIKGEFFQLDQNEVQKIIGVMDGSIGINSKWYIRKRGLSHKVKKVNIELKSARNFVMPFGKYKGYRLKELPKQYIEWLKTIELKGKIKDHLKTLNLSS